MSTQEQTALAMLRCGRSFQEAAESSGLCVEAVMNIWKQKNAPKERSDNIVKPGEAHSLV
jgi:hypothetical protein